MRAQYDDIVSQLWSRSRRIEQIRSRIKRVIACHEPIEFWDLVRLSKLPFRACLFYVGQLESHRELIVTDQGLKLSSHLLSPSGQSLEPYPVCTTCGGHNVTIPDRLRRIERTFMEIAKDRPELALFFGQRVVPPADALARVAYMLRNDDVDEKRTIFLGDDDLTSLALALAGGANRITVVDIDQRFTGFLEGVSVRYNLDIETRVLDLNAKLPADLIGQFDVFVADPYPTADASFESLFWSRGISMLDASQIGVGYTFSAPSHKPASHFLAAQKALTQMEVVITDMVPNFNEYMTIPGELTLAEQTLLQSVTRMQTDGVSHTKSLVRFETTRHTSPLIPPDTALGIGDLSFWLENTFRHDLVQQVGLSHQVELTREAVSANETWESALDLAQMRCLDKVDGADVGTSKASPSVAANLLVEVFGHDVSDRDFQELCEKNSIAIRSLATDNGYELMDDEIQALYLFSVGGVEALQKTELLQEPSIHQLYVLARLFESYYRKPR